MSTQWTAPIIPFRAGRQMVCGSRYRNDVSNKNDMPERILIKHTLSGCGVLYYNNRRHLIEKENAFVIIRPGPYCYCHEDGLPSWHFEYASIIVHNAKPILPEHLLQNPIINLTHRPAIRRCLKNLVQLMTSSHENNKEHLILASELYLHICIKQDDSIKTPAGLLRDFLNENLSEEVQIKEFAKHNGITHEGVTRSFQREYRISPAKYLRNIRIEEARRQLEQTSYTLDRIAVQCGFGCANYLCRIFKSVMGVTPAEYRRNPDPFHIAETGQEKST